MGTETGTGTLLEATEDGAYGDELRTLARILACAIDGCDSKRDLASLSKRYMDVVEMLEAYGCEDEQGAATRKIAEIVESGREYRRKFGRDSVLRVI